MSTQPLCPKCQSVMEPGFVIDRGDGNLPRMARWARGGTHPRSFLGLTWNQVSQSQARDALDILTLRCTVCGFLESYAPAAPGTT